MISDNYGVYSVINRHVIILAPGDPPSDLRAAVLNSTAISLTWSEPLHPYGIITSYTITYDDSSGTPVSVIVDARDTESYLISGLDEFTTYELFINASTRIGSGPAAELTVTTNPSRKIFFMHSFTKYNNKCHRLSNFFQILMHHHRMWKWL